MNIHERASVSDEEAREYYERLSEAGKRSRDKHREQEKSDSSRKDDEEE